MTDKFAKRKETVDSARYEKDISARDSYSKEQLALFRELYPIFKISSKSVVNIKNDKEKVKILKEVLVTESEVTDFLESYPETNRDSLLKLGVAVALGKNIAKVESLAISVFNDIYVTKEISSDTQQLKNKLPEQVLEFLPDKITIKTDPDGVINEITNRFQEQYETIGKKIDLQKKILSKYNDISAKIKKDLNSEDEQTKLAALIMAIIMETGIRPGKPGTSSKKKSKDGTSIDTFGATTLTPDHISFLKDSEVELTFPGKSGTINVASIQNKDLITILKRYVEHTQSLITGEEGSAPRSVFTTSDGKTLSQDFLRRYVKKLGVQGLRPTDFRKLRSTQAVLNSLNSQLEGLYNRISQAISNQTENLKERIVEEVMSTVKQAYKHAEKTLSHDNVRTTIDHYVNPSLLLNFLSTGKVADNLKSAIVDSKTVLSFDPEVFVQQAMARKSAQPDLVKTSSDGNKRMISILYKLAKLASSTKKLINSSDHYSFRF
jgi:predicted transcriptional regulator